MIVKELDTFVTGDTLARAGRKAEENLAHYLSRAFKTSTDFLVFNGLRLAEKDGDAAQMDHLILHRYGVIIVESKSVSSRVRINEHEEWSRFWNDTWRGMPSPIKQAERQGAFLQHYLHGFRDYLQPKTSPASKQESYCQLPVDVLVAISDSGIIDRPSKMLLETVSKADQITERIQAIYRRRKNTETALQQFNLDLAPLFTIPADELLRLTQLLTAHHRQVYAPQKQAPTEGKSGQASTPVAAAYTCRHCKSTRIDINYGRYGYYLKCSACDGNTPLNRLCRQCGGKEKTRKDGRRFFAECAACATSYAFHENARA